MARHCLRLSNPWRRLRGRLNRLGLLMVADGTLALLLALWLPSLCLARCMGELTSRQRARSSPSLDAAATLHRDLGPWLRASERGPVADTPLTSSSALVIGVGAAFLLS